MLGRRKNPSFGALLRFFAQPTTLQDVTMTFNLKKINSIGTRNKFSESKISGWLEIPLQLKFTCGDKLTLDLMNGFVKSHYDWNYTGLVQDNNDENDDEEESDSDADFVINTKDNDEKKR